MAKGVYRAANLLDMRVPDHLSVVGFAADDALWLHPPLTSVSIPGLEISRRAMELILTCLEGEIASFLEIIPMTLVVRASTAAPSAESGRDLLVAQTAANRQLGTLTRASPAFREQSNGCGPGVLIGMGVVL